MYQITVSSLKQEKESKCDTINGIVVVVVIVGFAVVLEMLEDSCWGGHPTYLISSHLILLLGPKF